MLIVSKESGWRSAVHRDQWHVTLARARGGAMDMPADRRTGCSWRSLFSPTLWVERIYSEAFGLCCPDFADIFVRGQTFESLERRNCMTEPVIGYF
jgi:hypothetical protein